MNITQNKQNDNNFLHNLNPEQLKVISHLEGPLLVLAGAGTGKTKVLTTRIANIIYKGLAFPNQILSVTFTNKAAKEMLNRLNNMVNADGVWMGTFHSIAAKILRKHATEIGLSNNFNIIDIDDQIRLIKQIIIAKDLDEQKYPAKIILAIIQKWKDLAIAYNKVSNADMISHTHNIAAKIYIEYQQRLKSLDSADFGDLLLYNLELFTSNPQITTYYQHRFRYILVDEYQDTSIAQYLWLRILAQSHKNICCVGDDDQSIYSWRGAEVGNILRFEQDFPGANIIKLEQNYRSSKHILAIASSVIANNETRLGKELWTEDDGGEKVKIISLWDEKDEASFVAGEIRKFSNQQNKLDNIAILVRAGFQTRSFEEAFITLGIPYKVIGGLRFYDRMEIRDVLAYIRIVVNNDDDLALERIINTPKRGVGKSTVTKLYQFATDNNISLFQSIKKMLANHEFKGKIKSALEDLIKLIEYWRELFDIKPHFDVVETIIKESGYLKMWQTDTNIEAETRVENIKELIKALQDFNNITEFLEHVSLVMDNENLSNDNNVLVMTLHAAKGLEFDIVFLPGWEEGIFPHKRAIEEQGDQGLEEERRLAYVGITRAKKILYISYVSSRRIFNNWQNSFASRFIAELPNEHIELIKLKNYAMARSNVDIKPRLINKITSDNNINTGKKVFHEKFGYGYIVRIDGNHLEIAFSGGVGIKKVVKDFITLA